MFSRTFAPLMKMYTLKLVYIISLFIFHDVVWTNFLWNYCVLVQMDAHIILTYISPYLAPTSFGWLPSSGSSQPNSLKAAAANCSLQ
jgi:hypothetical protein